MRLFTAVELEPAARDQIAAAQRALARSLGDSAGDFRFLSADQMHLTIVFIGNVDAEGVPALVETMSAGIR
jgi:2'-5' RNA ligase